MCFFDTGIEFKFTKEQIGYLEERYGINIKRYKAEMPVPLAVQKYGQPFLTKDISENISRLQKHGFQWENESYDFLLEKYPDCGSSIKWWTGEKAGRRFSIEAKANLKEFLMENPPRI